MKEVKSGERQKGTDRWGMWFWVTSIRCINHITEGLEHKRTYALWQLRLCFSPLFFHAGFLQPPRTFVLALLAFRLPPLSGPCPVTEELPPRLLRMGVDSHLRSPCWSSHANYYFPQGGAAKLTGTKHLWHTAVWVLIDCFAFQKDMTRSRLAMQNDNNWVELRSDRDQRTCLWNFPWNCCFAQVRGIKPSEDTRRSYHSE